MEPSADLRKTLLAFERNEITESHIYEALARGVAASDNRKILQQTADDERRHYGIWRAHTLVDVRPDRFKILRYRLTSWALGFTFAVKLMERGEKRAQGAYDQLREAFPEAETVIRDENQHEAALLSMLDEDRLRYTGAMVLGLSDALVEFTGTLAGLTLALRNARLIALTGSITGVAAALSMAASEYLSTRSEGDGKSPVKAAAYTGGVYLLTVVLLILPYLLLANYFLALAITLSAAILIIAGFTYYISVAKDQPFRQRFAEMALLSLGVAAISFLIGLVLRRFLGVAG